MCAIIGWSGELPKGLLTQLLLAAEHRGRDSAGVAFHKRDTADNFIVKQAVAPRGFVKANQDHLQDARQSKIGIAHTRRASPKMPIDNTNAHPFVYDSYIFAHNGAVRNWKDLKEGLIAKGEGDAESAKIAEYAKKCTTDSMVLGPFIDDMDFKPVVGSLGLVWLYGSKLFCFRSKKELTSVHVLWSPEGSGETNELTLVCSTWEIVIEALDKTKNLRYDAQEKILSENTLYEVGSTGPIDAGKVPVNEHNAADAHSSKVD